VKSVALSSENLLLSVRCLRITRQLWEGPKHDEVVALAGLGGGLLVERPLAQTARPPNGRTHHHRLGAAGAGSGQLPHRHSHHQEAGRRKAAEKYAERGSGPRAMTAAEAAVAAVAVGAEMRAKARDTAKVATCKDLLGHFRRTCSTPT